MKILFDFFPIILFFIVYKQYDDTQQGFMAATAVLIVASILQFGWSWWRHRRIERMPLIALILLLFFGGITLLLQDEVFLKWKPTVVNWLFGAAFLGSQFIGSKTIIERMMGHAIELPAAIWTRLNLAWTVFFIALGIINLYVAFNFDTDTWVDFKLFGMLGLTIVFVLAQGVYLTRHMKTDSGQESSHEQ
jgi:intracellular septation protein